MGRNDDEFVDWVKEVLKLGLQCLDTVSGEMLIVLHLEGGERKVVSFHVKEDEPTLASHLKAARELVAEFYPALFYGLVWNGEMKDEDGSQINVVAVECGSHMGQSLFLTQPFTVTEDHCLVKDGPSRIADHRVVENIWAEAIAQKQLSRKFNSDSEEPQPITSLEDLATRAIHVALDRMKQGNEMPFLCLAGADGHEQQVISSDDSNIDFVELADSLRTHVAKCEGAEMYAVVYFGTTEIKGKEVDMVYAETGDREGAAPMYGLSFKVSKSLKLTTGKQVELVDTLDNMWAISDA